MFVVTVKFEISPERADEFLTAMLVQAKNSLELEADCHVFDVCIGIDDAATIYLYEKYTDAAAFDVHLRSEHFLAFDKLVTPWVVNKTVGTWNEIRGAA